MIAYLVVALAALVWLSWLVRAGLMAARMYQIEEYEGRRLLAWGRQRAWLLPSAVVLAVAALVVVSVGVSLIAPHDPFGAVGLGWICAAVALHLAWKPLPAKKPLVYTMRMRRILGASVVIAAVATGAVAALVVVTPAVVGVLVVMALIALAPGGALLLVIGGNAVMAPVERHVQQGFVKQARQRMLAYQPLTIGIAGSYGKTSTKHITARLLNAFMETLATPKSYNTMMGVTRTVNENLLPKHRAFIVEMDAYDTGEIAAMCRLVQPSIAIITSVGPQHLERFGTLDRIGAAIYELVEALQAGSPAVIYCGDPECARLADRAAHEGYRVVRYGVDGETADALDVVASDIEVTEKATRFTWRWAAEGLEYRIAIPLLGRHNILNVSAALAVVHLLGLPVAEAVRDTLLLEAAPHRLQLMRQPGGVTIIDDSYNANPVGVQNGLDVLAQMRGNKKILVTPGMVELGSREDDENYRFGEHAAAVCTDIILVGERQTQAIQNGLRAAHFPTDHLHCVNTLAEVTAVIGQIAGEGDVVLFANDLPDTYLELG